MKKFNKKNYKQTNDRFKAKFGLTKLLEEISPRNDSLQ